ncbi:hypothetical protein HDV00_010665 [Rhizophlyctis rosea]|nr:hypothetical protein HDV00_010665 [Rhizophlyctis rosea]
MSRADAHIRYGQNRMASDPEQMELLAIVQQERSRLELDYNAAVAALVWLLQRLRVRGDPVILSSALFQAAERFLTGQA